MRSFRDPDGYIVQSGNRILRYVSPEAAGDFLHFVRSPFTDSLLADGTFPGTHVVENTSDLPRDLLQSCRNGALIVEHERIPFANYPYEWGPAMLHSAAVLTVHLARSAIRSGFILKDATPYNVMFDGVKPVFLDLLSFRRRDPLDSIWIPYAQFVRTFIYPLLAYRYFALLPGELLLTHRDGFEPDRMLALCPLHRRLTPPFLGAVTLPTLLSRNSERHAPRHYVRRRAKDAAESTFLLERLFRRAERLLRKVAPHARHHRSASYMDSDLPYDRVAFAVKEDSIERALTRSAPKSVLDVGCNTGHFSFIAARKGARVVAIDADVSAIDHLWRATAERKEPILPLVVDIARPTGACGWAGSECAAFLDRARGRFDCVFMLALIHHLLINERVPLSAILQLAADLTTGIAIVEYVDPADAQFQRIARGRDQLHRDITHADFEAAASCYFEIASTTDITPTRRIYVLRKRLA